MLDQNVHHRERLEQLRLEPQFVAERDEERLFVNSLDEALHWFEVQPGPFQTLLETLNSLKKLSYLMDRIYTLTEVASHV